MYQNAGGDVHDLDDTMQGSIASLSDLPEFLIWHVGPGGAADTRIRDIVLHLESRAPYMELIGETIP